MKKIQWRNQKINGQSGAVTIFLVIIFFAMILLIGLFIDLARIKAAQNQLRRAADVSARSVLADYNTNLRAEYALFGTNSQKANPDFKKYIQVNISRSGDQSLNLLDCRYESSNLVLIYPLGNPQVLKEQILETMKYKAPVEITRELIRKFMQFRNAAGFFDQSNEDRKSLGKIDENIRSIHESNQKIKQSKKRLDDAKARLKNINSDRRSEKNSQRLKELAVEKSKLEKDVKKLRFEIDMELHKSKRASLEMELELKKMEKVKPKDIYQSDNTTAKEPVVEDKPVVENTRLKMTTYRHLLGNIKTEIDRTKEAVKQEAAGKEISKNIWSFGMESASKAYEAIKSPQNSTVNVQNQAELNNQAEQLQKQYPELAKHFERFQIGTNKRDFEKTDGNKADNIADFFKNTFSIINVGESLIKRRDELFVNEYVLTYFSYMTSGPKGAVYYPYRKTEAEYICYGENYIARAVSELYLTRFALDSAAYFAFASNLPDLVGRTVVSLVMGALQASIDTFKLIALSEPVPLASVSPNNPFEQVTLTYKDHLRLFLLLNSDEQGKLKRITQLIKIRSGAQPEKIPTLSSGTVTVSIRMWFLPLAGIKDLTKGPFGTTINNGRCYITKDVDFGY